MLDCAQFAIEMANLFWRPVGYQIRDEGLWLETGVEQITEYGVHDDLFFPVLHYVLHIWLVLYVKV